VVQILGLAVIDEAKAPVTPHKRHREGLRERAYFCELKNLQ
jgi:hypothetical protein